MRGTGRLLVLAAGLDDPRAGPLDLVYFGLTAAFWLGHRVCSTWLAYLTTAYRPLVRAEPVRFVVVPCAIAAACFAILLPADDALPWTRAQRVIGASDGRHAHRFEQNRSCNGAMRLMLAASD